TLRFAILGKRLGAAASLCKARRQHTYASQETRHRIELRFDVLEVLVSIALNGRYYGEVARWCARRSRFSKKGNRFQRHHSDLERPHFVSRVDRSFFGTLPRKKNRQNRGD